MRLPKKLFHPKSVNQKKFYPEKWVFPKNCIFIKKIVSPEKRVSPEKMFYLKNLTNSKKVFEGIQHLCEDSEFSDVGKFWKISKVTLHM